jgi:hypothetical protein
MLTKRLIVNRRRDIAVIKRFNVHVVIFMGMKTSLLGGEGVAVLYRLRNSNTVIKNHSFKIQVAIRSHVLIFIWVCVYRNQCTQLTGECVDFFFIISHNHIKNIHFFYNRVTTKASHHGSSNDYCLGFYPIVVYGLVGKSSLWTLHE